MKKVLTVLITITILMTSLFVLTGCETKNNDNSKGENESGSSIDLEFDFLNHKKTYKANIKLNKEDEVTEHDEDELDFARIENSAENYVIDLTLSEDAEPAYEQFKSSAEENEFFRIKEFGDYLKDKSSKRYHPLLWEGKQLILTFSSDKTSAVIANTRLELLAYSLGLGGFYSLFILKSDEINHDKLMEFFPNIDKSKHLYSSFIIGYPKKRFRRTVPHEEINVSYM